MKILIDCRFAGFHVGIGRYTREIVPHILKADPATDYLLLVRDKTESWIPQGSTVIETDIPHYSFAEQWKLPGVIKRSKADLFFSPHFNIPLWCPAPVVVTIHDLILHRYPNQASLLKHIAYQILMKHAVMQARSIIAVSTFTKSELVQKFGENLEPEVTVIGEGVSPEYARTSLPEQNRVREKYQLHRPFYLYVGNAKEHKNVPLLLRAFEKASVPDTDLVLLTGGIEADRLSPFPPNIRICTNASDKDLPSLYSAARCFVTPSLYEGYCLPAAEALACGCPVIAVNGSALPETTQGHALLIEPTESAFINALKNPPVLAAPIVVNRWEDAAKKTIDVLHKASNC